MMQHGINTDLLCKTTGWQNNCGLNCLSHFIYHLLSNEDFQNRLAQQSEYQALLVTFQEYYRLSKTPTWDEIKQLLDKYPVATDREAILSPVLRLHLGKKLSNMPEITWNTDAAAAISRFLKDGKVDDVAIPLYNANKSWLESLKSQYDRAQRRISSQIITENERILAINAIAQKKAGMASEAEIKDQVQFDRANRIQDTLFSNAKDYWLKEGANRYGESMGNLKKAEMISAEQLRVLSESLSIGLEVYTPDIVKVDENDPERFEIMPGMKYLSEKAYPFTLKVHNRDIHWEFEAPNQDPNFVEKHNQYYTGSLQETAQFPLLVPNNPPGKIQDLVRTTVQSALERGLNSPMELEEPSIEEIEASHPALTADKFKELEYIANQAMGNLVNYLDTQHRKGKLSDTDQEVLFEFYFDAFEQELKKGPEKASFDVVNTLAQEIHQHHLSDMKAHAHVKETASPKKPRLR